MERGQVLDGLAEAVQQAVQFTLPDIEIEGILQSTDPTQCGDFRVLDEETNRWADHEGNQWSGRLAQSDVGFPGRAGYDLDGWVSGYLVTIRVLVNTERSLPVMPE